MSQVWDLLPDVCQKLVWLKKISDSFLNSLSTRLEKTSEPTQVMEEKPVFFINFIKKNQAPQPWEEF